MIARLKRVLHPLRPVLLPIWRRLEPAMRTAQRLATVRSRLTGRLEDSMARRAGRTPPIRPLRPHEIADLAATIPYYRARATYFGVAAGVARELIHRRGLRSALEIGPHLRSLIVGADTMELRANPALRAEGRRIYHDATKAPWPAADKAYDLFVALQVFEHLGTRQPEAFREVRRVARNAILSLPIDWEMANPADCHHRLSHERALSWFAPVVPTRVVVGNPGRRKRLIYVFEDLPAPEPGPDPGPEAPTRPAGAGDPG